MSPYTLTWNGDNYYVVGWSDKHNKIATFRVDRIYHVPEILSEDAVPKPKKYNIDTIISAVDYNPNGYCDKEGNISEETNNHMQHI